MHDDPIERIAQLRTQIGRIDQQILALVAWRLDVAEQIGHQKKLAGLPVRNFKAEVDVLQRARAACAQFGLDPDVGQALFQVLIEAAVGRQHGLIERPPGSAVRSVLVVGGCGRMGTWLCNFFSSQGHRVTVHDARACTLPFPVSENLEAAARDADVIVLSTPIAETPAVLGRVLAVRPRGLVFDICSLKSPVAALLHQGVADGLRVASVHPMFAPDTVLLTGRVLVVCDCGDPAAAADARGLFDDTALRRIDIPLDDHDRYMAYVLGLSHAVNIAFARTLATSGQSAQALDRVASTTFAKQSRTTREVAFENPQLYYEIQHHNAHTAAVLDRLAEAVSCLRDAALSEGPDAFVALMNENRAFFESDESS